MKLDLYAQQNIKQGINRSEAHLFLNTIIEGCKRSLVYSAWRHESRQWFGNSMIMGTLPRATADMRKLGSSTAPVFF